jgi:hypothetical protein
MVLFEICLSSRNDKVYFQNGTNITDSDGVTFKFKGSTSLCYSECSIMLDCEIIHTCLEATLSFSELHFH